MPKLNSSETFSLTAPVTQPVIQNLIASCPPNKRPGRDGLTIHYYKTFQTTLIPRLTDLFNDLLKGASLPKQSQEAHITLIHKENKDPEMCGSYRPISLINLDMKLWAKLLAERLGVFMPYLIGEEQAAAFADDIVFLITNPEESLPRLTEHLEEFGLVSNFKINFSKSIILNISIPSARYESLSVNSPFTCSNTSLDYLGIKLTKKAEDLYSANFVPQIGQISYGASDPSLSHRLLYPHVFRMVQNYHIHNMAISELLEHFGWTWVGILVSDDETGEDELQILTKYMRERGICAAFIITLRNKNYNRILQAINNPQVNIIIMCGTFFPHILVLIQSYEFIFSDNTFILSPSWTSTAPKGIIEDLLVYNGSLTVMFSSFFPGLEDFKKIYRKHDDMNQIQSYWRLLHDLAKSNDLDYFISDYVINKEHNYTQNYTVPNLRDSLTSGVIPRLYSAVEVLAKALHEMFLFIKDEYEENSITGFLHYRRKLQRYIQMMKSSPDPMRPSYYFNEQGEAVHPYKIINRLNIGDAIQEVEVGNYTPWAFSGEKLHINRQSITWKHTKEIPVSRCSDQCSPGSRKKTGETIHACCYDCVPCAEGEISNITDAENCIKCQSDEWPNEKRDRCLPKVVEFISYQNDTMASVFSGISVFGCLVTSFTFGIFIFYQDTPIVKANNRNLSYLLLVSIILSFLSVFLFLGRPSDVTCRLRETSFGIFFSIAVSSLLAKTTMVCVAFKSTKPGSPWRKWLNVKLPYTIVLLCSSIQVVICVIWLSIFPPFQDLDTQSYPGKIIIQCNEGSNICFYSMLGYMGLLAAVSFVLAFMVRTLPDSFNEAKYITFSMLLFCSVWISMIPAYLSTRGKYMVVVEIFAVMASSAGLLGCVFLPKCFVILFKSEMNIKIDLRGKRK
ncbi:vomeronasal type-2 receptor 26-like [Eleutherodactylus coqui]|uniref:vomeronasal type-2 receptor 26-like n=1 Tax=Eleutherodactylus coqui TaxID=57060 RepID=UPI0034626823